MEGPPAALMMQTAGAKLTSRCMRRLVTALLRPLPYVFSFVATCFCEEEVQTRAMASFAEAPAGDPAKGAK